MKKILVGLIVLMFVTICNAQDADKPIVSEQSIPKQEMIDWLQGVWKGVGHQIDGQRWDVEFKQKDGRYSISYPSLGCSGYWEIVQQDCQRITFVEIITKNTVCDQRGRVVVTKINDYSIGVAWFILDYSEKVPVAFTVLSKEI